MLNPPPCFIDEVQRVPELFLKIKEIVDEGSEKNLLWLTGSPKPRLLKQAGDTLAGRVAKVDMFPLSQAEKQSVPYRSSFYPEFLPRSSSVWDYKETIENIVLGGILP